MYSCSCSAYLAHLGIEVKGEKERPPCFSSCLACGRGLEGGGRSFSFSRDSPVVMKVETSCIKSTDCHY